MPVDLNLLTPEFRQKAGLLLHNCLARGYEMRPNEGLRNPYVQAVYWRQSRTREEVNAKIAWLKQSHAPYLAHCLEAVGPRNGQEVTAAIPGYSWHQWAGALDCYWVVDGEAVWSLKKRVNGRNGFAVYAEEAQRLGLNAGYFWKKKDAPHVQMQQAASPSSQHSLVQIDQIMKDRFEPIEARVLGRLGVS